MLSIGRVNTLTVSRQTPAGFYLDGGEAGDIFLSPRHAPDDLALGDTLDAFVLHDNDGSLIASSQPPALQRGEAGSLRVSAVAEVGAFLDWGLDKELLLPFSEQLGELRPGQQVLVAVYTDLRGRLVASMRLDRHLPDQAEGFASGQQVELLIAGKTTLGYKCIVEREVWGLIYDSELRRPLQRGEQLTGWIRRVRPDQRLDVTINKPARQRAPDVAAQIIAQLDANDGFLALGDKSPPEAIQRIFGVSKKAFKQGLSKLYKERRIRITERGIEKC